MMCYNMAKIKKDLIEKIINNNEVLELLLHEDADKNNLINSYIFDHMIYRDDTSTGNYIAIETSEIENGNDKYYVAHIQIGLLNESKIMALSNVITDIVNELYPDRKNFKNIPGVNERYTFNNIIMKDLCRIIQFEI